MYPSDEEIAKAERECVIGLIKIQGELVEAENEYGHVVQAYLYHDYLFDMKGNALRGYEVKKDWSWVLLICAGISLYLLPKVFDFIANIINWW